MSEAGHTEREDRAPRNGTSSATLRRLAVASLSASLIVLLGAIFFRPDPVSRPSRNTMRLEPVSADEWARIRARGQRLGAQDASMELVLFTDYECPFCRQADKVIASVLNAFPELAVVYRHYPIPRHLPAAYEKARIAECAAKVGRFAEIQALLYRVDVNVSGLVTSVARAAEIDDPTFFTCAADTTRVRAIEEDLALIRQLATRRTPSIFLDGRFLTSTPDSAELHTLIQNLLNRE